MSWSNEMIFSHIPAGARFRRAEGLQFEVSLCHADAPVRVRCKRQEGDRSLVVVSDAIQLIARLNTWQTAEEAGTSHVLLTSLVEADLLFWSRSRPSEDLTNSPLQVLQGKVALARNVDVVPLLSLPDGSIGPFPFMPRRGTLDQAALIGAEFGVMEMDTTTMVVRVACCARHGALLREVVPQLDGSLDVSTLGQQDEVRRLLDMLNRFGLLEQYTASQASTGTVTWLGHAAILYAVGGQRILVDPLLYTVSIPTRHSDIPVHFREIGKVSAVLITHGDNDHLNPQTLYTIRSDTPVFIPRSATSEPYHVDMGQILRLLGFSHVQELDEWERFSLGSVIVVAAPFRGEDWGLRLATRTYLISSPELTIFANADSTSTADVYARLASEFKIDLAFLGVGGASETYCMPPGYGYGEFYTPWIPREKRNEWVQLCNGPREAADAAVQLGARYVFGYAAGGASYCDLTYVDRGKHADLSRYLLERNGEPMLLAMEAGVPVDARRLLAGAVR